MISSRRDCLKFGVVLGAGVAVAGCANVAGRVASWEKSGRPRNLLATTEEERILDLTGFGPNDESIQRLRVLGKEAYLEEQLKGEREEDIALTMQLQRLDVLQMEPADIIDLPIENVLTQLQQAAILQAAYGRNQLRERMIDFWSNHFNIYSRKGDAAFSKGIEESQIVRRHALGSFPEMLNAMAHSPAMLESLDNQKNQRGVPNENYARELMELHTLGLHGGYSQRDVQEVARCFTGWTIENRFLRPRGHFRYDGDRHDEGSKTVLGRVIPPGGGEKDGNQVLDLLATHPSTAKFLATKLTRFLVGTSDTPWTDRLAENFLQSRGDIVKTIGPLLHSADFINCAPVLKRPFDFMVSALRVTEAETDGGAPLQNHLIRMGEPLYQWPMPDGYPVKTSSWTSSLLPRWNFAFALARGQIARTSPSLEKGVVARTRAKAGTLVDVRIEDELALSLASPEFQWR